ncbi:MAG: Unknown protein [uncultured Thiotrichaceae bacterium]|uniref:SPOR domain-containing protein n=1 Tax=uncultured Thiotrichaceae bacterium TaxID=298394 RepID=A0A6S6T8N3_9GAMM|nr:MAG: Unknown protein [uncultured Thiotrichaceae bacterium]
MKQVRRQTIKSAFIVSAMVAAMTGCSNQVETTGNTIPSTVPASTSTSTGKVCCNQQNTANNGAYNVLSNTNAGTNTSANTSASTNVYNPATRPNTQPAYVPPVIAQPQPQPQPQPQQPASNVSYYDYGGSNSANTSNATYNYSASNSTAGQQLSNDTRPAVQVLASGVYETAQGMQQQMNRAGYNAIVVQAGGLYKVRIPYGSYEEAKGRLTQIRSTVPDAFVSR